MCGCASPPVRRVQASSGGTEKRGRCGSQPPPEGGRANDEVVRLLADTLAVPRDSVTLVSGHGARDKIVELAGVEPEQIERRLASAAAKESRA